MKFYLQVGRIVCTSYDWATSGQAAVLLKRVKVHHGQKLTRFYCEEDKYCLDGW